jgi:hypothetical protein
MSSLPNQTQQNATQTDRLARVTIIDPTNPLYGRSFRAFKATLREDSSGSVTIILPDGQHRVIARQSTSLGKLGKEVLPAPDLPLVSVRTILPVVRLLRDKRILLGEGNNGTRNDNATKSRISAARPVTESTSAPLAGAGNRSQAPNGLQLGATHRASKGRARLGGST